MSRENNSRVPRLRFPGFTGEWEEQPLANFLFEHKTKSDGKCAVHSVSVSQGVVDQVKYLGRSFAAADTSKYNLAKPGDIIYTKSPTGAFPYGIIKQNKNPYNVIVSPLYAVYTPVTPYLGYILDSYFESPANTNNYLSSLVQKGAKNTINITNDTFVSKAVCLPTDPEEQKKIAECLAEMDKLISAQGENVDALKEKKIGLMQQLFPRNGETTPSMRFSGFEGDWEEKKLGDITINEDNKRRPIAKVDRKEGAYPYYGANGIQDYVEDYIFDGDYLLVGEDGSVISKDNTPVINWASGKFWVNNHAHVLSQKDNISLKFVSYNLSTIKIMGLVTGIPPKLKQENLNNIKVMIPSSPEEQKKIADCLTALDDQIAAESAKLEALKDQKTGLMQQLFPHPAK